jgi:hypothetical protein
MPKAFTHEQITEYKKNILYLIAVEGLSLTSLCKRKDTPAKPTVLDWLYEDEKFAIQYARACEKRADKIFDDIITISDSTSEDIIKDEEGNEIINHNVINRDRLRIDARKWMLGKMNPKKYGDRIDITSKDNEIKQVNVIDLISGFMGKKEGE